MRRSGLELVRVGTPAAGAAVGGWRGARSAGGGGGGGGGEMPFMSPPATFIYPPGPCRYSQIIYIRRERLVPSDLSTGWRYRQSAHDGAPAAGSCLHRLPPTIGMDTDDQQRRSGRFSGAAAERSLPPPRRCVPSTRAPTSRTARRHAGAARDGLHGAAAAPCRDGRSGRQARPAGGSAGRRRGALAAAEGAA